MMYGILWGFSSVVGILVWSQAASLFLIGAIALTVFFFGLQTLRALLQLLIQERLDHLIRR